jgi:hypothetical protein
MAVANALSELTAQPNSEMGQKQADQIRATLPACGVFSDEWCDFFCPAKSAPFGVTA